MKRLFRILKFQETFLVRVTTPQRPEEKCDRRLEKGWGKAVQ